MCGIIGTVGLDLADHHLDLLKHRGPDGRGLVEIPVAGTRVHLGHTRLAILDLSPAGVQPMCSRDGRWWVTFNGEIYNHLELRKGLAGPFRGHSDTETLVELLADRGLDTTLGLLNGMFAFAALDTKTDKLYLVRDPFGIKPLYYGIKGRHFSFASEARVLRTFGFGDRVSDRGLRQFLTLRYTPSPFTLWEGIERLPPGHVLCLDLANDSRHSRYYIRPVTDHFHGSMDDAVEAYRAALSAAVRRQLLSDVPVGVLLSGGVDSALVAAMARDSGRALPAFTVGFGDEHAECEITDAARTAEVLGLPYHSVKVTPDDLKHSLPSIVASVEEPLGTTSIMPMWFLARRAKDDVTVVLTGQGTDEPWGGYFRYQVELLGKALPLSPRLFRVGAWIARQATMFLPEAAERGMRTLAQPAAAARIVEAGALFADHERRLLLGDDRDGGARKRVETWLEWLEHEKSLQPAERMMRLDSRMNLADDLLLYGDKISMAVSLEARVPMLDLELVRLVESLPLEYRIRWRQGKVAHKFMAERYLPSEIVHRPKRGFQVPFGYWSRSIWRSWVETMLLEGLEGLLHIDGVEKLWRQHLKGKPDRSRQMFSLLILSLWNQSRRHD